MNGHNKILKQGPDAVQFAEIVDVRLLSFQIIYLKMFTIGSILFLPKIFNFQSGRKSLFGGKLKIINKNYVIGEIFRRRGAKTVSHAIWMHGRNPEQIHC